MQRLVSRFAIPVWLWRRTGVPWLEEIDFVTFSDKREQDRILSSIDIQHIELNDKEIDQLVSFLESLTGRSGNQRPLGKPDKVPSGLSID